MAEEKYYLGRVFDHKNELRTNLSRGRPRPDYPRVIDDRHGKTGLAVGLIEEAVPRGASCL
jgi:hypothetical protein